MLARPLDAMVLLACEPEADSAAGHGALGVLAETGFVACLSPYASPQMKQYAKVLLPVGTAYESSGTFINCEGRWQGFAGAARPVGEARPGWKVLRVLANQLGLAGFEYLSSGEIRSELEATLADSQQSIADLPLRDVALHHEGEVHEPGMYATDMMLRRSLPLQETREGRQGGRRWQ